MRKALAFLLILALLLSGCTISVSVVPSTDAGVPEGDDLQVHYIDVGQADCALIRCGGRFMLIDGGNVDDGQLVVSYLMDQGVETLDYVVCTHAHEDHVGGLAAVLAVFPTENILSPTTTYASGCFDDFMHYADQQRLTVQIPQPGDFFDVGSARVTVLGPVKSYADPNNTSIILKLTFGENSFLFTGDMEVEAENDMLDYWAGREDFRVDVLKVGHHCSETSTGYRFLYETVPAYGVISVGKGNTYGHPHSEPLSRLTDAGVTVFRTDSLGTVVATSDGQNITFTWENQSANPINAEVEPPSGRIFVGNSKSRKFHTEDCGSLPGPDNRVYFDTYQSAIDAGYTPCGSCLG